MRISDILKKGKEPSQADDHKAAAAQCAAAIDKPESRSAPSAVHNQPDIPVVRISDMIADNVLSEPDTVKLYEESLSLAGEVIREDSDYRSIDAVKLADTVARISQQITLGNELLLLLAFTRNSVPTNYLLCHSLNVCVYTLRIGLGLNYENKQLLELGVSAFYMISEWLNT